MQRHFNWLNAQRVDVPHLRLVESAVTADFQLLAGQVLAGGSPVVVRGFTIPVGSAVGNAATNLTLVTASGVILHPLASESGSVFSVPATQAAETLNGSNSKVIGAFVPGTNYIGIDLIRLADAGTSDSMKFLSDSTEKEFSQTLPLGRTLQYRIYVQSVDFDHALNVLPVAVVVVDTNGNVTSVTDARRMAFRLGVGGTSPAARTPFTSMASRTEPGVTADATHVIDPFTGGDKAFGSIRDWMGAVMTRLWELGSGAYWYSPTTRGDEKLVLNPATTFVATGTNWYWNGADMLWQGLRYIFAHGETGMSTRLVTDQTTASPGLTNLIDGDCLYVDLDRAGNTAVAATKAQYGSLPNPTIPGSRRIFAWRVAGKVYVEGSPVAVDQGLVHATISQYGVGLVYSQPAGQANPIFAVVDLNGWLQAEGLTCGADTPSGGVLVIGGGPYTTTIDIGGGGGAEVDITSNNIFNCHPEADFYGGVYLISGTYVVDGGGGVSPLQIGPNLATEVQIGGTTHPTKAMGDLITMTGILNGPNTSTILKIGPTAASEVDLGSATIHTKVLGNLTVNGTTTIGTLNAPTWTTPTVNATNWTAANGLQYTKDHQGWVHVKGAATVGATPAALIFTFPVGFRPLFVRGFRVRLTGGGTNTDCSVDASGNVTMDAVPTAGQTFYLDPICFYGEQ